MKISAKQYATALYDLTSDLPEKSMADMIQSFVEILAKKRALSLLDKIIKEFTKLYNSQAGLIVAKVSTAHSLSPELSEKIKVMIRKALNCREVEIEEEVQTENYGGIKIQIEDLVLDATLKSKIKALKNNLTV